MTYFIPPLLAFGLLTASVALGVALPLAAPLSRPALTGLALLNATAAASWLMANRAPYEGRTLWELSRGHGLTVTDLLALAPCLLAVALAVAAGRR